MSIKRILELHNQGLSTRAIARQLTEEKIPTMTGGEIWNFGTIAKMIKKHLVKGYV
jgi:hypothetical protein